MPRVKKEAVVKDKPAKSTKKTTLSKKVTAKQNGIAISVVNTAGKTLRTLDLPKEVFGATVNKSLMAQAVRVYLANQRAGTASTKTRGQVQGSTRKIYKQKGTGRARHGSIRAPIFVHGGVVFGPKPRDYSLSLPKKMKKKALCSALTSKLQDHAIVVVSGLEKLPPKTKEMVSVLKKLQLDGKRKNVLLVLSPDKETENVKKAARNIEGLEMIQARQLNTYVVLHSNALIFTEASIRKVTEGGSENG